MPLYNQTLYTTVSIAKTMDEISRLSYEKAREDLILEICKMYYLGQTTAEQVTLIKANITRLEELKNITVAFHDNGMAMEVDVKRVNINLENLKVQYDNVLAMHGTTTEPAEIYHGLSCRRADSLSSGELREHYAC